MAKHANTPGTISTVFLSAETPGKHKANSRLYTAFSSVLPAALFTAMVPVLVANCISEAVLASILAAGLATSIALGVASVFASEKRKVGYAAFAASVAAVLLILIIPSAREGLFGLYNGIVYRFDEVYGAYLALVSTGELIATSPLFGICFGMLAGTLSWAITRLHIAAISLIVSSILCGASLRLGCGIGLAATTMALCGWLSQSRLYQLRGSSYPFGYSVAGTAFSFVICIVFFVGVNALYSPNAAVDGIYTGLVKSVEQARYGTDTLPEGNLTKAPSMNENDGSGITITANAQPYDNLLLHGFTGAAFENGSWQPISHTAYEGEWRGVSSWLSEQGFQPALQRSEYNNESASAGIDAPATMDVRVDASKANSKYLYTPYTLSELDGHASMEHDGAPTSGLIGTRTYGFSMDNISQSNAFTDTNWLAGNTSSYASAESVYSAFVRTNYLDVPEEEKEAVNKLIFNEATWDETAAASQYAVISRVRTMLNTLASYSETPAAPDASKPFTQWFLADARSGNSAYFATVATLALRSEGIPARYVEGYRADMDDVAAAYSNNTSLSLDASDAHAWVEVYLNGAGWTPVEVTPGFYSQTVEADQVIDVNEARSNGSGNVMQSDSVMGQTEEDENQDAPLPLAPLLKRQRALSPSSYA